MSGATGLEIGFRLLTGLDPARGRLLVVVAHPDDETLGAGALIAATRRVVVVHTTDGAPRSEGGPDPERLRQARIRRVEARAALREAQVPPGRVRWLGFVDQQLSFHLAAAARSLAGLIQAERPAIVLTHAYEGGHPDHDATAFAVHAARALLPAGMALPLLAEMPLYHAGAGELRRLELLPMADAAAVTCRLTPAQQAQKRAMLAAYRSQAAVVADFPIDRESIRREPRPDFSRPPHPGPLHYESQPWGLTGRRWRELAGTAAVQLGLRWRRAEVVS